MGPLAGDDASMDSEVSRYLDRFRAFGAKPSVATYLPLFHPQGTLFDSGMPQPITVDEIPAHFEAVLRLIPDLEMIPERWRARDRTVFVEATNRATIAGSSVSWSSVYCMDLQDDRVIRGRRYYDRRALFARLNPDLPKLEKLPDAVKTIENFAGDLRLFFTEWSATVELSNGPYALRGVDRLECAEGQAPSVHSYFDTLELATRLKENA